MTGESPIAIFRADAGRRLGTGHLRRSLALAQALAADGWTTGVLAGAESRKVVPEIDAAPWRVETLGRGEEDAPEALRARWPEGADLLVVDHYDIDARYESQCRPWARRLLAIDDLANRAHEADDLLDQTLDRQAGDYRDLVPESCRLLLGSRYALLSRAFFRHRLAARAPGEEVRRILVAPGGTDPANLTPVILRGIAASGLAAEADVMLGSAARHLGDVRAEIARLPLEVRLHLDAREPAALMAAADLAIGAAGVSAWERCCLGLPSLMVVAADNQRAGATALARAGAAALLGEAAALTEAEVAEALRRLAASPERRRAMAAAALRLCDGLGAHRAALALGRPALAGGGGPVTLRPVDAADADLLLDWQRHPETRRHARRPQIPGEAEHRRWLEGKLGDPGCVFEIILHRGRPAGALRLDRRVSGDGLEVSINIAPDRQGQGIGRAALELAERLVPGIDLWAEILPENRASHRLFQRAGYGPERDAWHVRRAGAPAAEARVPDRPRRKTAERA